MDIESYEEGDFISIYDSKKANMAIAMSEDVEEGIIVRVKRKRAEMLICEKEEPTEQVTVKPFPPSSGSPIRIQPDEALSQEESDKDILDDIAQDLVSDVNDYLSEDQESKSDTLR